VFGGDKGTDVCCLVSRIADSDLLRGVGDGVGCVLLEDLVRVDAGGGGAVLAGVVGGTGGERVGHRLDIGIGRTSAGALPPSSRCRRLTLLAAAAITAWPARVEPVREIIAVFGSVTSASPTSLPPVTTLSSPAGSPASIASSARRMLERGVVGAGLRTTALPVARAGPIFQIAMMNGKFHGAIEPATPTGWRISRDVNSREGLVASTTHAGVVEVTSLTCYRVWLPRVNLKRVTCAIG
jgi:hypothetical protein